MMSPDPSSDDRAPTVEILKVEKLPASVDEMSSTTTPPPPVNRPVVPPKAPHVNYAWRSLDRVKYDRLEAGGPALPIVPPNALAPVEMIDPELILKTRAFDTPRAAYCICAHFKYNDACDAGIDCRFVHLVCLDPEARPYQKAGTKDRAALARCLSVPYDDSLGDQHQTPLPTPPSKGQLNTEMAANRVQARLAQQQLQQSLQARAALQAPPPYATQGYVPASGTMHMAPHFPTPTSAQPIVVHHHQHHQFYATPQPVMQYQSTVMPGQQPYLALPLPQEQQHQHQMSLPPGFTLGHHAPVMHQHYATQPGTQHHMMFAPPPQQPPQPQWFLSPGFAPPPQQQPQVQQTQPHMGFPPVQYQQPQMMMIPSPSPPYFVMPPQ